MFKLLFKHRHKTPTVEQKLAMQREMERRRKMALLQETALKAKIADKLKSYNAAQDTTISNFTLPAGEVEKRLLNRSAMSGDQDVWGRSDPRETGRWKKENRNRRGK